MYPLDTLIDDPRFSSVPNDYKRFAVDAIKLYFALFISDDEALRTLFHRVVASPEEQKAIIRSQVLRTLVSTAGREAIHELVLECGVNKSEESEINALDSAVHSREKIRHIILANLSSLIDVLGSNEFHVSSLTSALEAYTTLTNGDKVLCKDKGNTTTFDEKVQGILRDPKWKENPFIKKRRAIYRFKPEVLSQSHS